jgi:riboflavin synthase
MFTGLIEEVGQVTGIDALAQGSRLRIRATRVLDGLSDGSSVAVDGVCLTVYDLRRDSFAADVSPETIARTNLSYFRIGTPVNLERSLAVGQRMGGHFVQGHVDGIARATRMVHEGDFLRMTFTIPKGLGGYLVEKGSVALNGVSLTVARLGSDSFDVQLVPLTMERTNLTSKVRAEAINMEVDVLGKYVGRLIEERLRKVCGDEDTDGSQSAELQFGPMIRLPGD